MKRVICGMAAMVSYAVVGCSSPEPTGPLTGSLLSNAKTVIVSPSEATLEPGQTQQFSAQYFVNGKQKKAAFVWSSSNEAVVTVSSSGLATAVAAGEATITATTSGTSGTALVTVPQEPPQVVAHISLSAGGFGSAVSGPGVAWVTQPGAGLVSRIDIASGTITGSTGGGPFPVQVSANADGSRIYVPAFFSMALVMSLNTGTVQGVDTVLATSHPEDASGMTNTPAGDTVCLGITSGPVFKIDMVGRTVLGRIDFPVAAGYHFEWNQARTRLYASQRAFDGGRVFEIDPASFTPLRTFETGGSAQAIQVSADGSKLFVAGQSGGVIVWDIASNSFVTTYPTPGCSGYGMVRTPDNTRLWVSCVFEGQVLALNPTTGAPLFTVSVGGTPRELSFDASSGSLIVPNEAGWVDIIR